MISEPKNIIALIPCYNEEDSIASVIKSFPLKKFTDHNYSLKIVVVDNNSADRTAEIARQHGAFVLHEPKKGKGNAMRQGFQYIGAEKDTDYVIMLDGDDTYRASEALRMIELLDSGFCDVVIGSRLNGRINEGSMTLFNRVGNWIFSHLVRYLYNVNVTDVLSGYFAWKADVVKGLHLHLESNGFAIEMEMVTKMARLGHEIYCVPISYDSREGESHLRPIYDGTRILAMLIRNLFWKPDKLDQNKDVENTVEHERMVIS